MYDTNLYINTHSGCHYLFTHYIHHFRTKTSINLSLWKFRHLIVKSNFPVNLLIYFWQGPFFTNICLLVALEIKKGTKSQSSWGFRNLSFLQPTVAGPERVLLPKGLLVYMAFPSSEELSWGSFCIFKEIPHSVSHKPIWHGWFPLSLLLLTRSRISVHPVLLPQCIYSVSHYMPATMKAGFLCAGSQSQSHVYVRVCISPPGLWICRKGFCGVGSALLGHISSSNVS